MNYWRERERERERDLPINKTRVPGSMQPKTETISLRGVT